MPTISGVVVVLAVAAADGRKDEVDRNRNHGDERKGNDGHSF